MNKLAIAKQLLAIAEKLAIQFPHPSFKKELDELEAKIVEKSLRHQSIKHAVMEWLRLAAEEWDDRAGESGKYVDENLDELSKVFEFVRGSDLEAEVRKGYASVWNSWISKLEETAGGPGELNPGGLDAHYGDESEYCAKIIKSIMKDAEFLPGELAEMLGQAHAKDKISRLIEERRSAERGRSRRQKKKR